jgi:hypothetical protein
MNDLLRFAFFPWMILFPIVLILFLVAPILIAFVVYKDAVKRDVASPFVWALVASLVPFYIGLLLYILVGVNQVNLGSKL